MIKYLVNNRNFTIFAVSNKTNRDMKYKEFHRKIKKNGYEFHHAEGSHYFYIKNGKLTEPVPYHGSKEMPEPLRRKIARDLGIK